MWRIWSLLEGYLVRVAAARGQLFPWSPVFVAVGIGSYFGLAYEPGAPSVAALSGAGALLTAIAVKGPELWRIPATGPALGLAGFLLATAQAHIVAAPVLPFRFYGAVEGRVIDIDRSFSDQPRLTLDRVVLDDVPAEKTPRRVRIALHDTSGGFVAEPGTTILMTAHLSPPDGPTEPGGFDFQRLAWFSGIGAVGYARTPAVILAPPEDSLGLTAFRMRMVLSKAMQTGMGGQSGAFGAALMTGDRSGISQATNDALRASNLSHIISISGLHMGLLSGFVFALCRYGLALFPPLALRINTKKLGAAVALLAATFYMILAGPDVATRRAYIMAAVVLLAVLADRRAISLRSVAISALICLVLAPESLVEPGFQMSFGATLALIVGFEHWAKVQHRPPKLMRPVAMAVLSSLIAGLATAPISAAHFNRIAEYGLLANLLAVPVMGLIVMPAGVMAAILGPLGLAGPALWLLDQGCAIILLIADRVAEMRGAVLPVVKPPEFILPLLGLAGVTMLIASQRLLRGLGVSGVAAALAIWALAERPVLLISGDGTLVGVMTASGRVLSKPKGGGFIAKNWLQNDGDRADQATAFARPAFQGQKGLLTAEVAGHPLRVYVGKGAAARAEGSCSQGAIVVLPEPLQVAYAPQCQVFDAAKLSRTGAMALYLGKGGPVWLSAHAAAGDRLWNRIRLHPPRRSAPRSDQLADETP